MYAGGGDSRRGRRRNVTDVCRRLAFASIAGAVTGAVVAAVAAADVVITAVRPATARVGQVVQVEAGAYKAFARPMPLYLVPVGRVPKRSTFPAPPRGYPFTRVGSLDFSRHPRHVTTRFRVPRLARARYELVIYCDTCHRGRGGTLIKDVTAILRVR
jgi:hypothetical protein